MDNIFCIDDETIKFFHNFNSPLIDEIIQKIKETNCQKIIFGKKFNQGIDNLPRNLTSLTFGKNFNQTIDNLPSGLSYLTFTRSSNFNQKIKKLPKMLKQLIIPEKYRYIKNIKINFPNIEIKIE
jgi:hypothetical protein